ncbi:MAG: hypothetical protein JJU00_15485 [Opitutales bacterium]|nr:hypothetical protein [Opitutales bacterium]
MSPTTRPLSAAVLFVWTLLLLAPAAAPAQSSAPGDPIVRLTGEAVHLPSKGIRDRDDAIRSTRVQTGIEYSQGVMPGAFLATGLYVAETRNRFDAQPERWGNVREVDLGARWIQYVDESWGYQVIGGVRSAAERGVSIRRGTTYMGGGVLQHRFGPDLTLGAGAFFMSRLDRSNRILPIAYLDWTPNEHWRVTTANGVIVRYDVNADERHRIEVSALWDSHQFRTRPGNPESPGRTAVEEKGWTLSLAYRFLSEAGWSVQPFVSLAHRRDFEIRRGGTRLDRFRTGPTPGFGVSAVYRF